MQVHGQSEADVMCIQDKWVCTSCDHVAAMLLHVSCTSTTSWLGPAQEDWSACTSGTQAVLRQ